MTRRIRFFLESNALRGPLFHVGAIFVLLGVAALAGGVLALLIAWDEFSSPGDAMWWAVLRISDPGYLSDDHASRHLAALSLLLSIAGSAFLVGGVAAVMTQWLTAKISRWAQGTTAVPFTDHTVVVGWCERSPHIIEQLLVDSPKLRVVVIVDHVLEDVRSDLAKTLSKAQLKRVVLRRGSARSSHELSRAGLGRAARVILPVVDGGGTGRGDDGARRLRELAAVRACLEHDSIDNDREDPGPALVVELPSQGLLDFARALVPTARFVLGNQIVAEALLESLREGAPTQETPIKTLLIGVSDALPEVVKGLHRSSTPREVSFLLASNNPDPVPEIQNDLNHLGPGGVQSLVAHRIEFENLKRNIAELPIDLSTFDELVLLAERGSNSESITDDRTLATGIVMAAAKPAPRADARVVLELLDEDSEGIVELDRVRQRVTPRVVGQALARNSLV